MNNILHIDTSGSNGLVAITGDGMLIAEKINENERDHAAVINLNIESVVKDAGITMNMLSAIAVVGGPGSYTGLRIGLATAKGLCYALDKPLLLYNKLDLMCMELLQNFEHQYEYYLSILPARHNEYFICGYNKHEENFLAAQHIHEDSLIKTMKSITGKTIVVGTFEKNLIAPEKVIFIEKDSLETAIWYSKALDDLRAKKIANMTTATPFYLKKAYIRT